MRGEEIAFDSSLHSLYKSSVKFFAVDNIFSISLILAALKSNRLFATSLENKYQGNFHRVDTLELSDKQSVRSYLKGYDKEVLVF